MRTPGKTRAALAALALATAGTAAPPVVLENSVLRIEVNADSGAISRIELKSALRFPLSDGHGAGIAGSGRLWAPWVDGGGAERVSVSSTSPVPARNADAFRYTEKFGNGLTLERRISLADDSAEFIIEDSVRNSSGQSRAARVGLNSRQQAEPWRRTDRTWIGGAGQARELAVSTTRKNPAPGEAAGSPLFWRQIEQYGTGFLARIDSAGVQGRIGAQAASDKGGPMAVDWRSDEFVLAAGGAASWRTTITVDEGGGAPDQANAFAPVLARADFAAAGRSGQPVTGFATVVSPVRREVLIQVERADPGALGRRTPAAAFIVLGSGRSTLIPGKVARIPVTFVPDRAGQCIVRVNVTEAGRPLATADCTILIDGTPADPVWQTYTRKMPEETYRGTWEQIGAELARSTDRLIGPNSIEISVGASDNGLAVYRQHLPYYADFLTGIARAKAAAPERILVTEKDEPASNEACMDVAFYGPDGPINAFSKERGGPGFGGLGYVKVVPATGYRFHIYMHYGINSEGLSISGASLNEDSATFARGERANAARIRSGLPALPPRVGIWMLLASCRTVGQALAMMQDPAVPILMGSSNMLLLDRAGDAACVEVAGYEYHVYRRGGPGAGFYVAGNYPHEVNGEFRPGPSRGWTENTMLREAFLRDTVGPRQGSLGLGDVISIMQSHEAGGMCQHHYDNPGQLYTSCSFLAVTRTGDLWLSQGPPCVTGYVRHTLDP